MEKAEHDKMPTPPDLDDSVNSKAGVEYLDEGIDEKLVKEETDTNKMVVTNMLIHCYQILPSFRNTVKSFLLVCRVLKEKEGNHVQANTY